jgi:hypothetical protein
MVAALAGKIAGYDTQHVAGFWVVKLERQIFDGFVMFRTLRGPSWAAAKGVEYAGRDVHTRSILRRRARSR